MSNANVRIRLLNANKVIQNLGLNLLLGNPWRSAMDEAGKLGVGVIRPRAPRAGGTLAGSVGYRMDPAPVPRYVIISAGAENKGYRYGFALNAGHGRRHGHRTFALEIKRTGRHTVIRGGTRTVGEPYTFHYRGSGKSTKGWFSGARALINAAIGPILNRAAAAIEGRWSAS